MPAVALSAGTIHYEKSGPGTGRPVVLIHGYTMSSSLWGALCDRLAAHGHACYAPTWPLGAHTEPMRNRDQVTMEGVAAMVTEFLDALELRDVMLVGSDTGGAIAQIVATTSPDRLGAIVLTGCDAFEDFPPASMKPLVAAARLAPTFRAALSPLRTKMFRHQAYGPLAHADIDHLVREWTQPLFANSGVREDLRRFTLSMRRETMIQAGDRLPQFTKPALIAWSADEKLFPVEDGRRLAAALPNSRFELIERARTFSMIDRPDTLADLIDDFAWDALGRAA
jgi:pimeloyl-ACP methyl ester carboxylesterase